MESLIKGELNVLFSIDPAVTKLQEEAYAHFLASGEDKVPVWFMSKPGENGFPSETTIRTIQTFDQLAEKYNWPVIIFTGEEGRAGYEKTFTHCKILCHDFNRLEKNKHVTTMIQNSMMTKNVELGNQWMYIMNDDIVFTRIYSEQEDEKVIDDPQNLFTCLVIWQYQRDIAKTKVKCLGLTSMPVIRKSKSRELIIDDIRVCQAYLIDSRLLVNNGILVDENAFIWDDFDLFINAAYHGISSVGINWPIHFHEIRKMFSAESRVVYDVTKLSRLSVNLYKRWGKHVIPYFRVNKGMPGALNIKVGSCKTWMDNGCKIEVDPATVASLDDFLDKKITFEELQQKIDIRDDYDK